MNDFKVGDLIKGKENGYFITDENMTNAKVIECFKDDMTIKVLEHKQKENLQKKFKVENNKKNFTKIENMHCVTDKYGRLQEHYNIRGAISFPDGTRLKDNYNNIFTLEKGELFCCNKQLKIQEVYDLSRLLDLDFVVEKPILDEVEREYLSKVIAPYKKYKNFNILKKRIGDIEHIKYGFRDDKDIIRIGLLPEFKARTMYKGMEEYKSYTCEELGI